MLPHMSSGKCKIKQAGDTTTHPSECLTCRTWTTSNVGKDVENRDSHSFLVGMQNGKAVLEENLVVFYRTQHPLCSCVLVAQLCLTLQEPMDCSPPGIRYPWNAPGKNTRVCKDSLLQEIFLTQGLNPGLLHCR